MLLFVIVDKSVSWCKRKLAKQLIEMSMQPRVKLSSDDRRFIGDGHLHVPSPLCKRSMWVGGHRLHAQSEQ